MTKIRPMLNYLVIAIMLFIIALTAIFIYSSIFLKNKIIFRTVQQIDLISELITRSAIDNMSTGHDRGKYATLLAYNNIIGIDEVGIFKLTGTEAFNDPLGTNNSATINPARKISDNEQESFKKVITSRNNAALFDWDNMTYSLYAPLMAEGACISCHKKEKRVLGVLKIKLATDSDFALLSYMRKLIWILGIIVCLPVGALLISGSIIREKNKIHAELQESSANLTKTYNKLEETRHYLQMILDNSKAVIITTDTNGRIVEFNKEAEALLEYKKEEVAGKDVLMFYENPDKIGKAIDFNTIRINEVWIPKSREVMLKSKSGKVIHVILTMSTMIDDKARVIGTVGVGKDISEQKMLQFKLLQSEKLAGIGTLASGIAHEINNPLAGILGMAEAIRDENDIALIKSYSNDIIQYAINTGNIVKELSAYSRSARNEGSSTIDISLIMENSLKMAKHSESFIGIDVVTDLEKDCSVIANGGEMQQVFVNLIVNALHAMGNKGTLTIGCRREGAFIKAAISDTGHGIPEKELPHIYDPFFTTKPAGKGTGLGLYVTYKIITKYKGTIDVESKVGGGTTFTIKFPVPQTAANKLNYIL